MKLAKTFAVALLGVGLLAGVPQAGAVGDLAAEQARQQAVQPLNNQPMWQEVRSGQEHYTSVRGVDTGVLIQSSGETWRQFRNGPATLYGGIAFCLVLVALGVFYKLRGKIMLTEPKTGRLIERFSSIERTTHWVMAISFCVLALTGFITLFGKHVLLPVFGYTLFAWLAQASKYVHNFVGPVFLLSILVFFFMFVKDNVWKPIDALWIRKAGGLVSGEHVPSHRFNFGEKTWFWLGVVFLGLIVSVSGLVLNFPNFEQGRTIMQLANGVHLVSGLIVVCLSLGHIYIGTIGMEGALESMRDGYVDETWAKEHHELWYQEAKAQQSEEAKRPPHGASGVAPT